MTIGSLFAGIGGLELGLERAGCGETVWQVEQDAWCRRVLAAHWPLADRSVIDVRAAGAHNLATGDVICGGVPCQDLSTAGRKAGIDGQRSGLWREFPPRCRRATPDRRGRRKHPSRLAALGALCATRPCWCRVRISASSIVRR